MHNWLAALFMAFGLTDMSTNHCPTGCLAVSPAQERVSLQYADVIFQEQSIGREIALSYDMDRRFGPFQPTIMASYNTDGAVWIGAGARWQQPIYDSRAFAEAALMPGLMYLADGPDLGHFIQFRASVGLGYEVTDGHLLTLSLDHRSNGNIAFPNQGLETLSFRYSVALD